MGSQRKSLPLRLAGRLRRELRRRRYGSELRFDDAAFGRARRRARHFGLTRRCPVCSARLAYFLPSPPPVRRDAICPVCGSLEWHRFAWWYLANRHGDVLRPGLRVLHVAAEPEIRRRFQAVPGVTYAALDLDLRRATVLGDLLRPPFADAAFDLVYCSHVLEHVVDDAVALRELRRVTSPSGAALIQVPVSAAATWGDPSITDPAERTRLFGQFDHVRRYGPDVVDIIERAGWKVDTVSVLDVAEKSVKRMGLPHHEIARPAFDVFWCTPE